MEKEQKEIILYTDDKAAKQITVTGWVSRDGRFFGKDEHMARYSGCTHMICECGNSMERGWIKCESCRSKNSREKYFKLPLVEWDYNTPVYSESLDKYFFSPEEIDEFIADDLDDQELSVNTELMLVLCEENYYYQINSDYWEDVLPEDGDIPESLKEKLAEFNKFIDSLPAASWNPGKKRVEYKPSIN